MRRLAVQAPRVQEKEKANWEMEWGLISHTSADVVEVATRIRDDKLEDNGSCSNRWAELESSSDCEGEGRVTPAPAVAVPVVKGKGKGKGKVFCGGCGMLAWAAANFRIGGCPCFSTSVVKNVRGKGL